MKNSFLIKKDLTLSQKDMLVYATISRNSDANGVSHISRQKLADICGIKHLDTVTKHTNYLEYRGLLNKTYNTVGGKKLAEYHIVLGKKDFM